jgi:[acyl-carrier-protein] S-malonyltransferase
MELSLNEGALDVYPLSVATAYHSRFVEQSSVRLLQEIKDLTLKDPQIPLISYLSLDCVPGKEELKTIMADQLNHTVLWVDLIKKLRNNGASLSIEIGPGAVVSRTVRWIDRDIEIMVTATKDRLSKVIERYRMQDAGCKIQDT